MTDKIKLRAGLILPASAVLLTALLLLSISIGSVRYPLPDILTALFSAAPSKSRDILVNIRLPRILMAALVGMNLAVAGAYMQAVMRNPMADPGIIGVSTGAALAAVAILLVFPSLSRWVPIAAFLGGCLASALVFLLSWKNGADPIRLILSGVAVNALLGGGVSLLSLLYSDRIQGILLWVNGSLSGKSLTDVSRLLPFNAFGALAAALCVPYANALVLGDDAAKSLGIPVHAARVCLSAVAAYLTGISIASVGLIGFLGLIIPHVARMLGGSNYKTLIPLSALLGASLLVGADSLARTAFSPTEIPVGVVMSVLGGPFFIGLLRRKGRV
jgi:iron complex transport system permease protein